MTTQTLSELFDKRAELAGEIIQAEKRVRELRADLAAIESAIRVLRPGIELGKVVPRHVEYRPRYFKRGALMNAIREFMREHAGFDVTVADLLPVVIGDRALNAAEHQRVEIVTYEACKRLVKRGTVTQTGAGTKKARFTLS